MDELDADTRTVRSAMRAIGVPENLLDGVRTRARRTGRRQTGSNKTNRASRWNLDPSSPQYGTHEDCKAIELRLLAMMCEFTNAPDVDDDIRTILAKYIGRMPIANTYRDALTLERLDYMDFLWEAQNPSHGESKFHIGHDDPTLSPRHVPGNTSWRTKRSNLIQGDMTIPESRTKFVELIGRYFGLGEVTVVPDEPA